MLEWWIFNARLKASQETISVRIGDEPFPEQKKKRHNCLFSATTVYIHAKEDTAVFASARFDVKY